MSEIEKMEEVEEILLKYTISEIKKLILEYAYKCSCARHSSKLGYCLYCVEYQVKHDKYYYASKVCIVCCMERRMMCSDHGIYKFLK